MTNEEKQIEEMVCNACITKPTCTDMEKAKCMRRNFAICVIKQGYRKASDVARETIGEAIEVVRHFFDEAKMRADHETNVLLRCQLRGEQIGASLVEYALAELKKKYESEDGE